MRDLAHLLLRGVSGVHYRARSGVLSGFSFLTRRSAKTSRRVLEAGRVLGGIVDFYRRGDVSPEARRSLLNLHCQTNGRFTDKMATLIRTMRPARRPAPVSGFLGDLSVEAQRSIAARIERDGYYVFERRLPTELCDGIERFAFRTPCTVEGRSRKLEDRVIFDPTAPISKTYRVTEDEVIRESALQRLMADPSFLSVAEVYLKSHPILSMVNLWWSPTYGSRPGGDAAQEFHFDFDPPPIWLLFFVYLTDVGPANGAHVFVRGSHTAGHPAAAELRARGYVRISDEDIAASFGAENVIELYGKRGTVIAVDTRGFHKGKMLTSGHRLMAQLTYSCPPYSGAHGRQVKLPANVDPSLAAAIVATPRVYEKYR